jgi:carnitine O-palmitoyltransferase 1
MAEAHQAVAFSFSITHEGWDVNFDREVLHLVWQSGIRSWKKRIARFQVGRSGRRFFPTIGYFYRGTRR